MPGTIDLANESIDSVIQWLRGQRRLRPFAPLSELIDLAKISAEQLTDLACIDLIERKRIGQSTCVEDVLSELPSLATSEAAKLDLIDAELCVQHELGQTIDLPDYAKRFPELVHAINALAKLDRGSPLNAMPLIEVASNATAVFSDGDGTSFELTSMLPADRVHARPTSTANLLDQLVQPPPWFTREHVQSSSEHSCLIRGRDSNQNRAVALKVIRLTQATTKREIDVQLAAVEAASMVRHPAWVTPDVAAVESQSLAVIRPWVFGTRWDQARRHLTPQARLHDLARIGYAIQSAHDTATKSGHAAHGGIHLNNLIVDADGQVRIVDAAACIQPAAGEMFGSATTLDSDHSSTLMRRRHSDVRSLCALIRMATAGGTMEDEFRRRASIVDRLCDSCILNPDQPTACGRLSDAIIKLADGNLADSSTASLSTSAKSLWRRFVPKSTP